MTWECGFSLHGLIFVQSLILRGLILDMMLFIVKIVLRVKIVLKAKMIGCSFEGEVWFLNCCCGGFVVGNLVFG
jgi:hypothetical protein